MLKINVGGTKGWKKVDPKIRESWKVMDSSRSPDIKYDLNSSDSILLEDNSVDYYYTSHTLEHVETFNLPFVFKELHRTLKPGGKLRIVVPDFAYAAKLYVTYDKELESKKYPTKVDSLPPTLLGHLMAWWYSEDRGTNSYYSGHKTVFDRYTLAHYLKRAGFVEFCNLYYDIGSEVFKGLDFPRYKDWSLFVEAKKSV